jgi:hypothetical protein
MEKSRLGHCGAKNLHKPDGEFFASRSRYSFKNDKKGETVDLSKTYHALLILLSEYCLLSDWVSEEAMEADDISLPLDIVDEKVCMIRNNQTLVSS